MLTIQSNKQKSTEKSYDRLADTIFCAFVMGVVKLCHVSCMQLVRTSSVTCQSCGVSLDCIGFFSMAS